MVTNGAKSALLHEFYLTGDMDNLKKKTLTTPSLVGFAKVCLNFQLVLELTSLLFSMLPIGLTATAMATRVKTI